MAKHPPVQYSDYLGLDQLLSSQNLLSDKTGKPARDELLFIIVHQVYELWFKQIIFEIDKVLSIFSNEPVDERHMGDAVSHLHRIIEIQRLLLLQVDVIETMTPMDFLEFRELLYPASGFQSAQFRAIEVKLGLKDRLLFNNSPFTKLLRENEREQIESYQSQANLFELTEKWLERTPFLKLGEFDFWKSYQSAVHDMFERDRETLRNNPSLTGDQRNKALAEIDQSAEVFSSLFDQEKFNELKNQNLWRLSHKAILGALLILLYRDRPIFHMPFRIIEALQKIDENFTTWRYRHALMAHRMLGSKIGTGGSSGHKYLKEATEKHKVYADFFNLATYLIPRSHLPNLPAEIEKKMNFNF